MEVITIAHKKGGVGKSSTTFNLAGAYSKNKKVLTIGLDAQKNLSNFMQPENNEHETTIYDVLFEDANIKDAIYESRFKNIYYIPDSMRMGDTTSIVDNFAIKEALQDIYNDFDIVLIDNPPVITSAVRSAITASNKVIVTTELDRLSLENLVDMINKIVETNDNSEIYITPVKVVTNSKVHRNVKREIESFVEGVDYLTLTTSLPYSIEMTNRIYEKQILVLEKSISKTHRQLKKALLNLSKEVL